MKKIILNIQVTYFDSCNVCILHGITLVYACNLYVFVLPSESEKEQFLRSYPQNGDGEEKKPKSKKAMRTDVDPEVVKTAIYIKRQFLVSSFA